MSRRRPMTVAAEAIPRNRCAHHGGGRHRERGVSRCRGSWGVAIPRNHVGTRPTTVCESALPPSSGRTHDDPGPATPRKRALACDRASSGTWGCNSSTSPPSVRCTARPPAPTWARRFVAPLPRFADVEGDRFSHPADLIGERHAAAPPSSPTPRPRRRPLGPPRPGHATTSSTSGSPIPGRRGAQEARPAGRVRRVPRRGHGGCKIATGSSRRSRSPCSSPGSSSST